MENDNSGDDTGNRGNISFLEHICAARRGTDVLFCVFDAGRAGK